MNRMSVNECAQCGADLTAAEWSEHLTDHCIRNVWFCDACGRADISQVGGLIQRHIEGTLAAILRASSLKSNLAAERRPGSSWKWT